MTEETESMVLELLRRMRSSMVRMVREMAAIRSRMTGIVISASQMAGQLASQSLRLDRLEERIGRIERRLDLVEHH
jgi:hypothetical protein